MKSILIVGGAKNTICLLFVYKKKLVKKWIMIAIYIDKKNISTCKVVATLQPKSWLYSSITAGIRKTWHQVRQTGMNVRVAFCRMTFADEKKNIARRMMLNSPAASGASQSVHRSDCSFCFDSWSDRDEHGGRCRAGRNEWIGYLPLEHTQSYTLDFLMEGILYSLQTCGNCVIFIHFHRTSLHPWQANISQQLRIGSEL